VSQEESTNLESILEGGRQQLEQAAAEYGRSLSPEEYWWLGVGLAAVTLAELGEKPYAVGRLEQLIERAGYKGVRGDWLQRFTEELAVLDAEGLIWPLYQRSAQGAFEPTGVAVHPGFDGRSAYFVALGHIAVALAVLREQPDLIGQLAGAVGEIVTAGLTPAHEALILGALREEPGT
jgi:hypothetical protein